MNEGKRDNISETDQWLDTTLHHWADRTLGKVPSDLHSQVVRRMAKPVEQVNYQRVTLAVAVMFFCGFMGWLLILRNSNREIVSKVRIADANKAGEAVKASAPTEQSSLVQLANPDQEMRTANEFFRRVELLEAQLLTSHLDTSLSELEKRCRRLKDRISEREQNCSYMEMKQSVITQWLANQ